MSYHTEVVQNPIFLHLATELAAAYQDLDAMKLERDLYKEAHEHLEQEQGALLDALRRHERTNFHLHGKIYSLQQTIRRLVRHRVPERMIRRTLTFEDSSEEEQEVIELIDLTAGEDEEL